MAAEDDGVADAARIQIPLFSEDARMRRERREARQIVVRQVVYCGFPRAAADQRPRLGLTRDVSSSGMCLRAETPEPVGALLRVIVRAVDGGTEHEAIARVAWTWPAEEGGHWMGLAMVEAKAARPLRVRPRRLARAL
jgi:hypothetical protein